MPITFALKAAVIDCLELFPGIEDEESRKRLINQAKLDAGLARRLTYSGSVRPFCELLMADLEEYGRIEDGYCALQAVIEAVRRSVDRDARRECDAILLDLGLQLALAKANAIIRTQWYYVLAGFAVCALCLFAIGYVLPVVGQPISAPSPAHTAVPVHVEATSLTPTETASSQPTTTTTSSPVVGSVSTIAVTPQITHAGTPIAERSSPPFIGHDAQTSVR